MKNLIVKTIGACLRERAEKTPDMTGMSYREESYTWSEIDEISDFLAVRLLDMGITHNSHGAIWSVNSPGWLLTYFAMMKLGAGAVLINTCYKENELKAVLEETDTEYLFYGKGCKSISYQEILSRIPTGSLKKLKQCVLLERESNDRWFRRRNFPDTMAQCDRKRLNAAMEQVKVTDLACIIFTSGTTSRAKGVMLSHYSLVNNSRELGRQLRLDETDKICISVPLFHCFGITAGVLAGIQTGAVLHLLKYYKTIDVLEQIERYRCTILNGVPTMFLALIRNEKKKDHDLSSLKKGILAGSPITAAEYFHICRELNLEKLQVSYGQTESSPCITISGFEDSMEIKSVTAGKLIPEIELRIWNKEAGREAGPLEQGEIHTRGYHVMMGYYHRPEETQKALDEEGWLHTGDLGFMNQSGYLSVTGRMKNMIIRGGENISPLEIEECISQMEEVEEVKVIGIAAAVLQEEIAACIIPKPGSLPVLNQVQCFVKERLANYKVPEYVLLFQAFPENSSGKIKLQELRKLAEEMIGLNKKDKEE